MLSAPPACCPAAQAGRRNHTPQCIHTTAGASHTPVPQAHVHLFKCLSTYDILPPWFPQRRLRAPSLSQCTAAEVRGAAASTAVRVSALQLQCRTPALTASNSSQCGSAAAGCGAPAPALAAAAADVVAEADVPHMRPEVCVAVLMGLPLLMLAALSPKRSALSRHSASRWMPATMSGASGATCSRQQ